MKLNLLFLVVKPLLHSADLLEAPRVTVTDSQEAGLLKEEVVIVMATAVAMLVRKTTLEPTILGA